MSTGAHVIEQPQNEAEAWLGRDGRLATKAGIGCPSRHYEGADAFATALQTSALWRLDRAPAVDEQGGNRGVLVHEIATRRERRHGHACVIQGLVNTLSYFSRASSGACARRFRTRRPRARYFNVLVARCAGSTRVDDRAYFSRRAISAPMPVPHTRTPSPMGRAAPAGRPRAGELPQSRKAFAAPTARIQGVVRDHPPIEERSPR